MKNKIFVTFSNTSFTKNAPFYNEFIKVLEEGCSFHIIHKWYIKNERNPQAIYKTSVQALKKADVMVVEASEASTGVGQLISIALYKNIRIIICVKQSLKDAFDKSMLKGISSHLLTYVYYKDFSDLKNQLINHKIKGDEILLEKFNFLATKDIKNILIRESRNRQISQSELLREIIYEWAKRERIKTYRPDR